MTDDMPEETYQAITRSVPSPYFLPVKVPVNGVGTEQVRSGLLVCMVLHGKNRGLNFLKLVVW